MDDIAQLLELAKANPDVFHDVYESTQQTILLRDFSTIMFAISEKAKGGDTAAAKFIAEFVSPLAQTQSGSEASSIQPWEPFAIQLRDSLNIEISAEQLVCNILQNLLSAENAALLAQLIRHS